MGARTTSSSWAVPAPPGWEAASDHIIWVHRLVTHLNHNPPVHCPSNGAGVDLASLVLTLDVNGERRQTGRTGDMIYSLQRQVG